jgi:hypothetical protein
MATWPQTSNGYAGIDDGISTSGPSIYVTKTKTEMNNYSAIYSFLWLSPSSIQTKTILMSFLLAPTDNLSPTKMDFIFVGFPTTGSQQK